MCLCHVGELIVSGIEVLSLRAVVICVGVSRWAGLCWCGCGELGGCVCGKYGVQMTGSVCVVCCECVGVEGSVCVV